MRGDGRVFQRGQVWWVAYYHGGREFRESSKSQERKDAVRLLRTRIGVIAAGTAHHSPISGRARRRVVTMQNLFDLLENYYQLNNRSSTTNGVCLRRLRRRFAGYTAQACTSLVISQYMTAMQQEGLKAPTINRVIAVLRSAFRLGYHHDLIARVPAIKLLPEHAVRNEFFTPEEVDALLPCLPEYLRDAVLFAFLTGWRRGEIIGLKWTNVNRSGGVIRLEPEQNKSRKVRVLALRGKLADLVERRWQARYVGGTLAPHVFHRAGRQLADFRGPWLSACHRAGLGHRLFHSLRRSAARNMSLQGVPEKVIMSIMGHNTRVMFDRYNIVTEADQGEYIERLFGSQNGQ